jgi:hypothetical protein
MLGSWLVAVAAAPASDVPEKAGTSTAICGLYGVEPASFATVVAAGINVVHSYRFETSPPGSPRTYADSVRVYLDAAQAHGLRALVGLPRTWFLGRDAADLQAAIELLRAHPALLAWYEEEQGEQGRSQDVEFLNDLVNRVDPEHGLIIEENRRPTALIDVGRIRMFTYYPVSPAARQAGRLPSLVDRLPQEPLHIPFWPVLQAYGQDLIADCPKVDLAMPTRSEMQYSLYSAVVHGASGLFFYTYRHPTRFDAARKQAGGWPYVDYEPLPEVSAECWSNVLGTIQEARYLFDHSLARQAPPAPMEVRDPGWLEVGQWAETDGVLLVIANGRYKPKTVQVGIPPGFKSFAILYSTGLGSTQPIRNFEVTLEIPGPGGLVVRLLR